MDKLRHREGKGFAQSHRAGWWQSWSPLPQALALPPLYCLLSIRTPFLHLGVCLSAASHFGHSQGQIFASPGIHCKEHEQVAGFSQLCPHIPDWLQNQIADLAPIVLFTLKPPHIWFVKKLLNTMSIRLKLNWSNPCLGLEKPLVSPQMFGPRISYLERSSEVDLNFIYFHCYLCLIIAST